MILWIFETDNSKFTTTVHFLLSSKFHFLKATPCLPLIANGLEDTMTVGWSLVRFILLRH